MTVQELIDKLERIDDKSKTVCVIGPYEDIFINDVEESTSRNRVHLVCNFNANNLSNNVNLLK